jgi:hypothetical protein
MRNGRVDRLRCRMIKDLIALAKSRPRELNYASAGTFLEHDGVPWNNNNAEHAIRRFVKHRRDTDGRYSEKPLKEYLILASVFETCEFNNVNVLKFLTKDQTLDGLLRMAGRRTTDSKPSGSEKVQASD